MNVSIKEVRDRIGSVSNTKKITEAMKLVAAAKVRRAPVQQTIFNHVADVRRLANAER